MPGVGTTFVGCIGVGLAFPDEVVFRSSAAINAPVTLSAPSGIRVGELMVACVEAGAFSGGAGPYTLTADPAWTPVYEDPSSGATYQIIANLYSKIADAADEAGTSSYSWSVSTPSTLAGMAVAIVGWGRQFGTTITNPIVDHTLTPSVASPGGVWQLAYIVQRTASGFLEPTPDPVVTSTATLFVPAFGNYREGRMRVYGSNNVSPITGAYLQGGIDFNTQALVVAAVSA